MRQHKQMALTFPTALLLILAALLLAIDASSAHALVAPDQHALIASQTPEATSPRAPGGEITRPRVSFPSRAPEKIEASGANVGILCAIEASS